MPPKRATAAATAVNGGAAEGGVSVFVERITVRRSQTEVWYRTSGCCR
jgi:hypothetical protein